MAIQEVLALVGGAIKAAATAVWTAFLAADVLTVCKAGFFVGCAAFTVYLIIKHFRDKKKLKKKTAVNKSLDLQYETKADDLHPKMKKIKKSLTKGHNRSNKKVKNSEIDKIYRQLNRDDDEIAPVLRPRKKRKNKEVPAWADSSVSVGDIMAGVS